MNVCRKKIGQLAFNVGGDTQIPITASIGFAAHTGHPDYNLLLRDADNALYAAKRDGPQLREDAQRRGDKTAAPGKRSATWEGALKLRTAPAAPARASLHAASAA
ncbi:diguanylate cyclase [Klebsiella variicola]|uniref:Diguanylate cyclase n=1 Tax=Klebsiella variicola TaxID=244366 RepID=A0A7H4MCL1_KLEVA|nr:diguanylate cyclase [Klebsiella variicola]